MTTIRQLLLDATHQLAASDSPRLDAEVLLAHALGKARSYLHAWPEREPDQDILKHFEELLSERRDGKPVAYLTSQREFWSLALFVNKDVLIPRPETEILVEKALLYIPDEATFTIADLGTGSGAIALSIALERPFCHVIATDNSPAAIRIARHNAQRLQLANVYFACGNWCELLAPDSMDILLGNPPYVEAHDPHLVQGDVRFEPEDALVSGMDGLSAIRQLVRCAKTVLKPNGWLLMEHGYQQGEPIHALLETNGYTNIITWPDLAGQPRVTGARRHL